MRRADWMLLLCAALGGCMKIYPDPELPDIEVSWYEGDCQDGTGDVVVALDGIDDPTDHTEVSVPCTAVEVEFPDVARERYRITGTLLDATGAPFSGANVVVDLRNGISAKGSFYFGGGANLRIPFVFDMGATCDSLNAFLVGAELTSGGQTVSFGQAQCFGGAVFASVPPGTFTAELRALDGELRVVAASQPTEIEVEPDGLTSAGPITLVPCGASCPSRRATLQP